jgi:hypothetical protein
VTGHAYPWDVLGDPSFVDRCPPAVTLAAAYHSVRAATPLHPARQIVDARYAALYRPVRDSVWTDLRPLAPDWMDEPDPFGTAAAVLRDAGRRVNAWIVLTHNTRLGLLRPDVTVVNCFGERYPYALCPAHAEVRHYAATLAAEAVLDVPVDGISLEACGQLGVGHLGHHEKTGGAWSPQTETLLSICCCAACRADWPVPAAEVVRTLRDAVRRDEAPPDELLAALLAVRHANTDALRRQVLDALPPGVPVTLHAHPDPWVTGPSPGLTPTAEDDVDALLVPAWPTTTGSADLVRQAATTGLPVDAYVTVLAPTNPDEVLPHVHRLRAAGASRISLYHLGLAPRRRQELFAAVTD